ncbi:MULTISPECIES: sigma factor G inhibitor Gin [Clostridium]|uniref:Sigma factor G inhibitor Gin n=1 Tax=Clostridium paridis TaxID=2803863 RepID=A0A937K1R8_9CLOT|nr:MULTISPECIES: sigma factor G inhibitor Gin [Clostridium]MBL4930686.1 sigma factor G inhibitor Gin [Clostridium paridis]MDD7796384.1 sigma factor G inhibitor Gin [Clostridium sp. 'White wine YQ']
MRNRCIICGKNSEHGIIICGKEICLNCEKAISEMSADSDKYELNRRKIRKHLAEIIDKSN